MKLRKLALVVATLSLVFGAAAVQVTSVTFEDPDVKAGESTDIIVTAEDSGENPHIDWIRLSVDGGEPSQKTCDGYGDNYCRKSFSFSPEDSREYEIKAITSDQYSEAEKVKKIDVGEADDFSSDPSVSLTSPSDGASSLSTSPKFQFVVTDRDTSSMEEVTLAVEEYDGSGDNPWTYRGVGEEPETEDLTYDGDDVPFGDDTIAFKQTFSYDGFNLDDDEQYVWGVKVDDGDGDDPVKSTNRRFNTGEKEPTDTKPNAGFRYSPDSPRAGETVYFTSTSMDPDGGIRYTLWDLDDDGKFDDARGKNINKKFQTKGEYPVSVKVVDYDSKTDTAQKTVSVREEKDEEEPDIELKHPGNTQGTFDRNEDRRPTFRWRITDDDNRVDDVTLYVEEKHGDPDAPWAWHGKGEKYDKYDVSDDTGTHSFRPSTYLEYDREYNWGLKVEDGGETYESEVFTFKTEDRDTQPNEEPVADLQVTPYSGEEGTRFEFDASGSYDNDGSIQVYKFDFDGDGHYEKSTQSSTVHRRISDIGRTTAKLKVVDNDGASNTDTDSYYVESKEDPNTKPGISLRSPGDGATELDPSVNFRWKITDEDDSSMDDVRLVIEKKNFDGDEPWDNGRSIDVSNSVSSTRSRTVNLDGDSVYVWGVKADDGSGYRYSEVYEFRTAKDDGDEPEPDTRPEISLRSPGDGSTGIKRDVDFSWRITDEDDSSMDDVRLVVEEKSFNGDDPWDNGRSIDVSNSVGSTRSKTVNLDEDTVYVWGVKADDGEGYHRSAVYDFRTASGDDEDEDDDEEKDRIPDISLRSPGDGATGLDRDVNFKWRIDDEDDSSMQDVRLVVEKKSYNGDVPWDNGRSIDVSNNVGSVHSESVKLDSDAVYVWGVKADDGDGYHRSPVYEFRTSGDNGDKDEEDEEDAVLEVDVEDAGGDALDAYVDVDGPEYESGRTGSDGEIEFNLEEGDYDVDVSKSGYVSEYDTVDLESGEKEELDFKLERKPEDIEVMYTRIPGSVCRGEDLTVTAGIRNNGGPTGLKLGVSSAYGAANREASVPRYETVERSVTLRSISGRDSVRVEFDVEDGRYGSFSRTVDVRDCGSVEDVSIDADPSGIDSGGSVRVSGYLDDGRGDSVDIKVDGYTRKTVTADRRGYYETNLVLDDVGKRVLSAHADDAEASAIVTVRPTVNVASVSAPERVFQSEEFEVCGEVKSQIAVQVQLLRDGKVVDSKSGEGNVCFDTETIRTGDLEYGVRAAAYGASSTKTSEVEVLETDSEVETFPDKIATVKSEDGVVSVDLYNTGNNAATYEVSASGMPENWFSTTDKSVELVKGERKTVYLYTVPEAEGSYDIDIDVERNGRPVHETSISVTADGTVNPQQTWREKVADLIPF